jgi:hypothetical protein
VQVGVIGYPNTLRLKAAGSGAAAHMSLHLFITMSKSRLKSQATDKKPDTEGSPILLPEERCPAMLATRPQKRWASRPVKGPLGLSFDSVNSIFAILFQKSGREPERAVLRGVVVGKALMRALVP